MASEQGGVDVAGGAAIIVSIQGATVDELRKHIKKTLPHNVVKTYQLGKSKRRKASGKIILRSSVKSPAVVNEYAQKLRHSTLNDKQIHAQVDPASLIPFEQQIVIIPSVADNDNDDEDMYGQEAKGVMDWENAKLVASRFFDWIHEGDYSSSSLETDVDLDSVEREQVSRLFEAFLESQQQQDSSSPDSNKKKQKSRRRLESLVMASLRKQKLLRSKRYDDGVVVCAFAREDRTFAPTKERKTARDRLLEQRQQMQANKGGVIVSEEANVTPSVEVLPINQTIAVEFPIHVMEEEAQLPVQLVDVLIEGTHAKSFQQLTKTPCRVLTDDDADKRKNKQPTTSALQLSFRSKGTGVYRATFRLVFQDAIDERFMILRTVLLRSGDADMYDILKPTTPYEKKKRAFERPVKPENVVNPPSQPGQGENILKDLKPFRPPLDVRELVGSKEMEGALVPPTNDTAEKEFSGVYSRFWQNLLWVSELQADEDIKLFDMENARLQRHGRFFKLYVAGLAEGRPSVLRGDLVLCNWKGKQFRGRVFAVELLDVLLEFHSSFHKQFNVNLDTVELVRFTFSRTTFRTSHEGCLRAPKTMGPAMLFPQTKHAESIRKTEQGNSRTVPSRLKWTSQTLNDEQKLAVEEIAKGSMRPLPYVIFGPPGTGKTTTLTETVYQLANLYGKDAQEKLKILLVAPSNDAADILVEKLSPYFPPSMMMRVLAYSRSIDQVPSTVQPYVREGLTNGKKLAAEIMANQIVVSTVNLAARFWCSGVQKGHFDVLCVDEAGHATEPEVIAVASTLMNFTRTEKPGQIVLAGDPMQLGPIITSDLCKKFGMAMSYMERLVKTSPAYSNTNTSDNGTDLYPSELITLLVRNYRSHPAILKLPNEMFYHNKLLTCGDMFTTHSMAKWEHLPTKKGFPVVFHAVDGENLREGNSPSWYNPQECIEVVNYVGLLVKHSRPAIAADDIGIITPYARQVQKIRIALKAKDLGDVKVGSVETFQGQERRCIIISTVRSEQEHLSHDLKYNLGFVANEKRFNVAVTRAKALLIVVGNPRVLATDKKNWLPFLRYCRDNGSWRGDEWDETDGTGDDMIPGNNGTHSEGEWEVVTHPSAIAEQEGFGFISREE